MFYVQFGLVIWKFTTLLWEFFEYESEVMPGMMLDWLDLCQFHMTKETQYRIEQLRIQPISPGSHYASRIIKKATTGLKSTVADIAIPNSVEAGIEHLEGRDNIVVLLGSYSKEELNPYLENIEKLLSLFESDGYTADDVVSAYEILNEHIATSDENNQ